MIYSTAELAQRSDIPLKTLNHWIWIGALRPSASDAPGTGRKHEFTERDLRILDIVKALKRRGVPFKIIPHISRALQASRFSGSDWILATPDSAEIVHGQRDLRRVLPRVTEGLFFRISTLE